MPASVAIEELRTATRIGVRTPVVVYYEDGDVLVRMRAWTDDLSTSGARLTTEQELPSQSLYARIMLPELKDKLIECEVVREVSAKGNLYDIRRCCYGIRFNRLADEWVQAQAAGVEKQFLESRTKKP
jgi:hypothetical protein